MSALTTPPDPEPPGPAAWQRQFVEQVGLEAPGGVSRSIARVIAWLVVCEPRHQSAEQLRTVLVLSAGSISQAANLLVRLGVVNRRTFPGDRRIYYELHPDGWQRMLRIRLEELQRTREHVDRAIEAAEGRNDGRLAWMRDFYAECEAQFATLVNAKSAPHGGPRKQGRRRA